MSHRNRRHQVTLDRLPPHSTEAEQGVLGCCLLEPNTCVNEVVLKFANRLDTFYDLRHQTIYETLTKMAEERKPIDLTTVQQHLKDRQLLDQVGGIAYLSQLQDEVPSAANLSYYLEIVEEKATVRRLIQTCTKAIQDAYECETTVAEMLDKSERDILAVRPGRQQQNSLKELINQALDKIEWKSQNWDKISGLSTGLHDLDQLTDGIHSSEFVVLAAYPSTGKTALMVNIAVHNALKGIPVAILSAEMRPVQLVIRTIMSEARTNYRRLDEHDIAKITGVLGKLSEAPIHCENINGYTVGQVEALARRMVQQHGVKLFVVDYMQLLTADGDNTADRLNNVSKGLKRITMEHDVPLIVGSQLNDDGKLKGSRAGGEDGDSVWTLKNKGDRQPQIQPIELWVDKSRDGETGKVPLTFLKTSTRIESAAHDVPEDTRTKD